ncbi:MAG: glycosyltransferase [Verrucomicrobia bacterium]|jgi:glycosyltransferase involved in cell wall biosynthesis|nr:glycosyltransferase [Verrucomicrobiota bacterium]
MTTPRVSICLPNLNKADYLEECIQSLVDQTFTDWEMIISDNFSDDGSWKIIQSFADDPRITAFQSPRAGMYANWNVCIKRCQGDYVYIATSDDLSRPRLLEKMVALLEAHRNVDIAVCDFDLIDQQSHVMERSHNARGASFYGEYLRVPHLRSRWVELLVHLLVDVSWTTITAAMFRRSLFEKTGLFREDCGVVADHPWAVQSAFASDTVYLPERLATWRQYPSQGSTAELPATRAQRYKLRMIEDVVKQHGTDIPEEWKADDHWRETILSSLRNDYLRSFALERRVLRTTPVAFLRNLIVCLGQQPGYAFRRLVSGLTWNAAEFSDGATHAHELVRRWGLQWPPLDD